MKKRIEFRRLMRIPTKLQLSIIFTLCFTSTTNFSSASSASQYHRHPQPFTANQLDPIDVSYQFDHDTDTLVQTMSEQLQFRMEGKIRKTCSIEVDASSSVLLNEGASSLIASLKKLQTSLNFEGGLLLLNLAMRMDGITSVGASHVINEIKRINSLGDVETKIHAKTKYNEENITSEINGESSNVAHNNSIQKDFTINATSCNNTGEEKINNANISTSSPINGTQSQHEKLISNDNNFSFHGQSESRLNGEKGRIHVQSIDISFNDLSQKKDARKLDGSLRSLIESDEACPQVVKLNRCGLGARTCRSIAKGIIKRYGVETKTAQNKVEQAKSLRVKPISLHLSGNVQIGDAGAAALAAALRIILEENNSLRSASPQSDDPSSIESVHPFLKTLDLSSCGISDAGAEALALALELCPGCVENLILSNNRITDIGATAIGNSLSSRESSPPSNLKYLNLDNNKEVGDQGAVAIAYAMENGALISASLRSCSIGADGSMAFGRVVPKWATVKRSDASGIDSIIDLSGNQFGTFRPSKSKKGKSLLKSKASATTASYLNFIGKKIKGGLKDVAGVDVAQYLPATSAESDDDFEESNKDLNGDELKLESMVTATKCGARAFADSVINWRENGNEGEKQNSLNKKMDLSSSQSPYRIAMRLCSLEKGGADALAALIVQAKKKFGLHLQIDTSMNSALDAPDSLALNNIDTGEGRLQEMAKRHLDAIEALHEAQARAAEISSVYKSWDDDLSRKPEEFGNDNYFIGEEMEDFIEDYDFNDDGYEYDADESYEGDLSYF